MSAFASGLDSALSESGNLAILAAIRRFISREQPRGRAPSMLLLEIDVGERRAVVVTNNEGCLVDFFNVPRSRKAALLHFIRLSKVIASLRGRLPCAGRSIIRT